MDSHRELFDVLLLSHYNVYERYPELVQRVDYFLHEWNEELLARTESLLRKQARSLRNISTGTSNAEDDAFTHSRSLNVAWRQWAVCRLQLPRYPPERINWNKDADPVFLYGQMPALRLEVPWSAHSMSVGQRTSLNPAALKPALKRTDLQTFLTSPTLSPAASPPYSPLHSPAMSVRESMSTSSFTSDATLENETPPPLLKPRLRFNDKVEQCMVVFNQEKEYLPTDYEDNADDCDEDEDAEVDGYLPFSSGIKTKTARRLHRTSAKSRSGRSRHTLVIKLAPTHLKGDHRKLAFTATANRFVSHTLKGSSKYGTGHGSDEDDDEFYYGYNDYYDEEEDPFSDTLASLGRRSDAATERTVNRYISKSSGSSSGIASGVSGYVQGYVQSVAGQVRKLVSDAVSVSTFSGEKAAKAQRRRNSSDLCQQKQQPNSDHVVSDPFASCQYTQQQQQQQSPSAFTGSIDDDGGLREVKSGASQTLSVAKETLNGTTRVTLSSSTYVVRDPFSSAPQHSPTSSEPGDHVPFDDDEDAIIQEFEREMQKYNGSTNSSHNRNHQLSSEQQQQHLFSGNFVNHNSYPGDQQHNNNGQFNAMATTDHWDDCEYDMYDSEFQSYNDDDGDNEFGFRDDRNNGDCASYSYLAHSTRNAAYGGVKQSPSGAVLKDPFSSASSARESSNDMITHANSCNTKAHTAAAAPLQQRIRNDSIIDRAEDTIVNTVDAVKWCASFISNYTIF
ncbi:hypothetical protein BX070DRAFT_253056 [Coemansia spiralis]|nr:hypothetical protein BX070DRAFT_253056 [Coemansia spiralis]